MIKFKCAERIVEFNGKPYDFSGRINNRWYFLCVLARNSHLGGTTSLDQLRNISVFKAPSLHKQIANWFNDEKDSRVAQLADFTNGPTTGPYFLKDNVVEILDGEAVFRQLGLNIEPVRPPWREMRDHLEGYVRASALFQRGELYLGANICTDLINKKKVHQSLRLECGLLLARSYMALGFFKEARQTLEYCKSEQVTKEFRVRVMIAEGKIDYFAERFDEARRGVEAQALQNLSWYSLADWHELSALLDGRDFKRYSAQADAAGVRAERRRLRKLAGRTEGEGFLGKAQRHLEHALYLRLLHGDPHGLQATCFNLGNLLWKIDSSEGRAWVDLSEKICKTWGVGQDTILARFVLARIDLHDGKPEEAWGKAQKAFDVAHQRENVFDRATAHRQYARYYFSTGTTEQDIRNGLSHAWVCHNMYKALNPQESIAVFERDFPGRVSEARREFGANLKRACEKCATLPVFVAGTQVA